MDRPFFKASIDDLERVFEKHTRKRPVLAQLYQELDYRSTDRADQLRKEIRGVLDGEVPLPEEEPLEDSLDYQMSLEDLLEKDGSNGGAHEGGDNDGHDQDEDNDGGRATWDRRT